MLNRVNYVLQMTIIIHVPSYVFRDVIHFLYVPIFKDSISDMDIPSTVGIPNGEKHREEIETILRVKIPIVYVKEDGEITKGFTAIHIS